MKAKFFERDCVLMVDVEVDASTRVDLVATKQHKSKYAAAWDAYNTPADDPATEETEPTPKKKTAKKKAK